MVEMAILCKISAPDIFLAAGYCMCLGYEMLIALRVTDSKWSYHKSCHLWMLSCTIKCSSLSNHLVQNYYSSMKPFKSAVDLRLSSRDLQESMRHRIWSHGISCIKGKATVLTILLFKTGNLKEPNPWVHILVSARAVPVKQSTLEGTQQLWL